MSPLNLAAGVFDAVGGGSSTKRKNTCEHTRIDDDEKEAETGKRIDVAAEYKYNLYLTRSSICLPSRLLSECRLDIVLVLSQQMYSRFARFKRLTPCKRIRGSHIVTAKQQLRLD